MTRVTHLNSPPAPETIVVSWYAYERVVEIVSVRRVILVNLILALLLLGGTVRRTQPPLRFMTPRGEQFRPQEIAGGSPLRGNTAADLAAALTVGRDLAWLRFTLDSATLLPHLQAVYAQSTPAGRASLVQSVPAPALASLLTADGGTMVVREWGTGATAVGESPGRVRVTVPLIGQLISRHVPFTAPGSGVPLAGTIALTLQRGTDHAWRLDKIGGEVLDSGVVALWWRYGATARPLPQYIENGVPISPDSAVRVAWTRPWRVVP